MKTQAQILLLAFYFAACSNNNFDEPVKDLTPYENAIYISASSRDLPLNAFGQAILGAETDLKGDITMKTVFYANGVQLPSNVFTPVDTGEYSIKGIYKDLESEPIIIHVTPERNKKVLIEYFTSRTCGWCPWIGSRLDSLDLADKTVISYSVHGEDEMQIPETNLLQDNLQVFDRPAVRINRGYVRNYAAPIEIKRLTDSVNFMLSKQTPVELAIASQWQNDHLDIEVMGKFYSLPADQLYLSVVVVEDNIISNNQYNYFSGSSLHGCPYTAFPNPMPTYQNHNVLRRMLTDIRGDEVDLSAMQLLRSYSLGSYIFEFPALIHKNNARVIAFLHYRSDSITISSVVNAQQAGAGESVGFEH